MAIEIDTLGALERVWDKLYPAEPSRHLRHVACCGGSQLVAELAGQEAPALAASEPLLEAAE